jgi:hypothetical protein
MVVAIGFLLVLQNSAWMLMREVEMLDLQEHRCLRDGSSSLFEGAGSLSLACW